ncbi:lectin [Mycena belliarum]|uniref:Lectin n=1 Tax=Mycena belliarum TaxID=1033014 RepID=A0AAD6XVC7_9AGAR|nr:lectin [Mycena belliae]
MVRAGLRLLYSLLAFLAADFAVGSTIGKNSENQSKAPSAPATSVRIGNDSFAPRAAALDFGASKWIWTNELLAGGVAPVGSRAFRKTFIAPLGKVPVTAVILITVDDAFTLSVNGAAVGTGENWQFAESFCVALQPYLNVFAVTATNDGGPAGILATVQVTYNDGSTSTFVSDSTWRASPTVPAGYEQLSYDDNSWAPAIIEGAYGVAPWGQIAIPSTPLSITRAQWIWTNEVVNGSAPPGPRAFRRTYTPPFGQIATSATIIITVDDQYSLYINGILVGSGATWPVAQTYTVNLTPAPNVVFAVYAVNGGGPAGLLATMEITTAKQGYDCSSGAILVTDGRWKSNSGTPIGFQLAGYDDSSWPAATVEGPEGIPPWGNIAVSSSSGPVTAVGGAPAGQKNAAVV